MNTYSGSKEFPPLRRTKQQLSTEICHHVLAEGCRGVLAVCDKNNYPYAVPLNFLFSPEANALYFHGSIEGHKGEALAHNPKASFNIISAPWKHEGEWWNQFNSVTLFGRVSIITDNNRKNEILYALAQKYYPNTKQIEAEMHASANHTYIYEFAIEKMTGKHIREK